MKIKALLAAFFALLVCAMPALAQTSSPEDRQRFVTIVHNLERTPLDPGLRADRSWAIKWLTDAPDVSVTICADVLGGVPSKDYAHSPEILVQYMLGMGAFAIENPGKADDADAQQLAGVESALKAYGVMRTMEPDKKSPALEKLLALQMRGELPGFVQKAFRTCMAAGAG
ncbi:MAG: hypothetical protein ACAH11_03390 [Sphingomonas sp.]